MRWWRLMERVAHDLEAVGVFSVLIVMVVTVVDVIGAKVFRQPLRGATDLVGLAQLVAIGAGLAMACFAGRHVALEFIVDRLPRRWRQAVQLVVGVLGLGLFGLLARESWRHGRSLALSGQLTSTAGLPYYPFAYALALFAFVTALYFTADIARSLAAGNQDAEANDKP
ncbi:MAG: TRAP transporter small permease [Firmicutes bacterium]|nr:TRAP transporter small permease [Bacillota bacterium]